MLYVQWFFLSETQGWDCSLWKSVRKESGPYPTVQKSQQEGHEIPTVYHLLSTSKGGAFAGNLRAVWAVMVTQAEGGQACQRPAWSGLAYAQLPESLGTMWRL